MSHRRTALRAAAAWAALLIAAGCTDAADVGRGSGHPPDGAATESTGANPPATSTSGSPDRRDQRPPGEFTLALAGDVNFSERTAARLDDPATAFAEAAPGLADADLTMVNLETAIAVGGTPADKAFTFIAPPTAFDALRGAGIDVITMANNHAADYRADGLDQTLSAIAASGFPTVGIGSTARQAYAPWLSTVRGVRVAILAATQIQDETLRDFTARDDAPGVASAFSPQLLDAVTAARAQADVVVVYLHWGIEYDSCPSGAQRSIADDLVAAGATAVVGTHAHVLQGDGWRADGAYIAYGLGNYLWWRSYDNEQDDNGVLTLTFRANRVAESSFAPSRLDERGVPMPATGAIADRINAERDQLRSCADLLDAVPSS